MSASTPDPAGTGNRPERTTLFERLRVMFGMHSATVREDIADAIKEAATDSGLSEQERVLLENVLSLNELRVQDVMVPRADVIAVDLEITLFELLSVFRTAGHSRLPVFVGTLDDPRGMVHIRDFVDYVARAAESAELPIRRTAVEGETRKQARTAPFEAFDLSIPLLKTNILRAVLFAPPSMPALDLLVKMQASRTHMALVIDEYGGTDGLVSIEDIVEKIVGDIEDEHDQDEQPKIESIGDGGFVIDARAGLDDLSAALGRNFANAEELGEIDTVAGFVTKITGRVPVRGEIVKIDDALEFEILDADPRRVKRLRARVVGQPGKDG